jgi:hypothetical protein
MHATTLGSETIGTSRSSVSTDSLRSISVELGFRRRLVTDGQTRIVLRIIGLTYLTKRKVDTGLHAASLRFHLKASTDPKGDAGAKLSSEQLTDAAIITRLEVSC